jgi:hypothetical protein
MAPALRNMERTIQHQVPSKNHSPESTSTALSNVPLFPIEHSVRKVPSIRPFVLLVRATCRWRWEWGVGGMIVTGENQSSRSYTCPSSTLSTTRHTSIGLRSYLGLCGDRPTAGHLSHDTTNNGRSVSLSWHVRDRKMCLHGNHRCTEQCTASVSFGYTFNMFKRMK